MTPPQGIQQDPAVLADALRIGESVRYLWPEVVVVAAIVLIFLFDLTSSTRARRQAGPGAAFVALVGIGAALWTLLRVEHIIATEGSREAFLGMAAMDTFGSFFRALPLLVSAVVILLAEKSRELERETIAEFHALTLTACLGMMLLATANDLLMIYLSLETLSIISYVLVGYVKGSRRSAEASLKYLLFGAVASGTMLFGLSILYGLTGSTSLPDVADMFARVSDTTLAAATLGGVLTFAGYAYKISAAPLHVWAPDVYEGAPTPVTALLTVGSKAAGFAALIRFAVVALAKTSNAAGTMETWSPVAIEAWPMALAAVAVLTMTIGNMAALTQTNIKRLLGYSSIAHAGYMLMGLAVLTRTGVEAIVFYTFVYYLMTLGAFVVVSFIASELGTEDISDYRGLGARAPIAAVSLSVFLFSLIGVPPLAGFAGKYQLFVAVLRRGLDQPEGGGLNWYLVLAIIAALNSAVALFYYARVLKAMYLDDAADEGTVRVPPVYATLMILLAAPTVLLGVWWQPIASWARSSADIFTAH